MAFSDVAILIAALNEEIGIYSTICEIKEVLEDSRFVAVDGGSFDKTAEVAKSLGAEVFMQNGKGKGDAIHQGLIKLYSDTSYVILIDGDYTCSIKMLRGIISILHNNSDVGMVFGR